MRTEANEGLTRGILVPVAIEPVRPPLAFRLIQTIDIDRRRRLRRALVERGAPLLPAGGRAGTGPVALHRPRRELCAPGRGGRAGRRAAPARGAAVLGRGRRRQDAPDKETERLARARRMLVLRGRCVLAEGAPPYQPLLEQIERPRGWSAPEAMRERLGENAAELGQADAGAASQRYADIPDPVDPAARPGAPLPAARLRRVRRPGGAGSSRMLLVFEDLHWADESHLPILLRHLAERLRDAPGADRRHLPRHRARSQPALSPHPAGADCANVWPRTSRWSG